MNDPAIALSLYGLYMLVAFGGRTVLHYRRTGSSGFLGISGTPGSAEWAGGVLFVCSIVLGAAAPALQLAGALQPLAALNRSAVAIFGVVLAVGGTIATVFAQRAMGASWRVGVDADEVTSLVTSGPFAIVRNPVFAAMLPAGLGFALVAPNVVALAGVGALLAAVELQTRVVEEPYLLSAHGDRYAEYAARVGRFAPGLGRLRPARG